ncbi:hypothetical protein [Hymenobacter crusticola]|uniref:Uncharacterized protein n=1 Tax=Hymenobacter crusticola TaxID=1770526 RepID=A0A243WJY1_9BACT|nr:hypothetical protein [Hymenobacter crusticola]OUJ75930.1 hypothetical protein BXP70_01185 [Hymenobacter crusticola]
MSIAPDELHTLGNINLLQLIKTAFFCSRNYPPAIERTTYLWVLEQRRRGHCLLSGFHSQLEQSIFRYLLARHYPIVYALGRGIQMGLTLEYEAEIQAGHLLFVTPFEPKVTSTTQETVDIRNLLVLDLADNFFVPYMAPDGNIEQLFQSKIAAGKPVVTLDLPENEALIRNGATIYQPSDLFGKEC